MLREIRFPAQGAIPIPPQTPSCWHSHANSSPLVITLSLNQLTTTAGVRLLTAHCWMAGDASDGVCDCDSTLTCTSSWGFYFGYLLPM